MVTTSHLPLTTPPSDTTTASEPRVQPGDIILYPAQPGSWIDRLIVDATAQGNPDAVYSHCGIVERVDVSPGDGAVQITTIEALSGGISRVTFPYLPDVPDTAGVSRAHVYAHIAQDMEPLRIAHALTWLGRTVGAGYSWLDIAADAVQALLPPTLGSRTPFLIAPSRFDCSDLATRFLLIAGYEWLPDEAIAAPSRMSPNDVARMTGVLEP